jgi:hypothetical protein
MSRSSLPPTRSGDSESLPPDIEAEVFRLTQQFEAADRNNDALTQVSALEKLAALPGK